MGWKERSRASLALAVAVVVVACGGAYSGEEPAPSPSTTDAGADAVPDATCDALDFRRALIVAPDAEPCPEGTTERLLVTAGEAEDGACSCGTCTVTAPPSCTSSGTGLNLNFGGTNTCAGGTVVYAGAPDDTCFSAGGTFNLDEYNRWTLRTPAGGTCAAPGVVPDPTKVKRSGLRTCTPSSQAVVCSAISARRRLCTESLGGGCGGDFPLAITAGDSADLSCSPCGCTPTAAKCIVEYHGNAACTNLKHTSELDGTCRQTNSATNVTHYKFHPSAPTCVTTSGTPSVTIVGQKQYCCTP